MPVDDTLFTLEADANARRWLDGHPSTGPWVIAYDAHRCCGGGVICQVSIREMSRKEDPTRFATGVLDGDTTFLIDPRAAARLPASFGLTVRGLGPLKHLDLELDGEQWGQLLYT
jgi:hypothetical protein